MNPFDGSSVSTEVDGRLRAWMATQAVTTEATVLYDEVIAATRTARQRPRLLVARANGVTVQPADRAWPSGRLTVVVVMVLALTLAVGLGVLLGSRYLFQTVTPRPAPGAFIPTGDVPESMGLLVRPAIAVLQDGRVLLAGGGQNTGGALVYDPDTGTYGPPIPMPAIRQSTTATTLKSGKVLITGGNDGETGLVWTTAELYDPVSNTFQATGSMAVPRQHHTATLLEDGRVLIVGGHTWVPDATTALAEVYDPDSGVFSTVGPLAVGRAGHTATRLIDGRIAIVGGFSIADNGVVTMAAGVEVFDPATETFSPAGQLLTARAEHGATLLSDGRILIIGGNTQPIQGNSEMTHSTVSAELFDAATMISTEMGSLTTERSNPSVTVLRDGRVLVAGGYNGFGYPLSAEVFDPKRGVFDAAGNAHGVHDLVVAPLLANGRVFLPGQAPGRGSELYVPGAEPDTAAATPEPTAVPADGLFSPVGTAAMRTEHTATLLDDGRVLIVGGYGGEDGGVLASAELFDPATGVSTSTGSMASPRAAHMATLLPDGRVVITGQFDAAAAAEIYDPTLGTFGPASAQLLDVLNGRRAFPVMGLPRGKVVVSDDENSESIAILDLVTGELGPWVEACYHRGGAVALPDGTVLEGCGSDGEVMLYDLVAGTSQPIKLGEACDIDASPTNEPDKRGHRARRGRVHAEVHAGDDFSAIGSVQRCPFWGPYLLPDGRVLAMTQQGGRDDAVRHSATLVYDPATRTFTNIEPVGSTAPMAGTVAQLADGDLVMFGGNLGNMSDEASLLDVTTWEYRDIGRLLTPRTDATATTLRDGRVLIVGGADQAADRTVAVPPGAELFDPSRLP